jgi:DNA-binding winged helix-turn-helix (wHTH) protein
MPNIYVLGPFLLDTQNHLLFCGGERVALGQRAIALLRALVERPGAVVSKDALIEAAWPGQAVEESNLTVQIAALRRVLVAAPGGDRWIETMPRRGYRFVGPVVIKEESDIASPVTPGPLARDPAPTPRSDAEQRQITVMSCELISAAGRADTMDLEALRAAAGVFQRCASDTVARHDGVIVSGLGNTVLVLFGYPSAHEHDAEQAVRAGLELCSTVKTLRPEGDMPMRCLVGIATGMAVVGDVAGVGEARNYEIAGDTPELAVRLRISAPPDAVAIERATRRLIGDLFDCRGLNAIETGGGESIPRWQVAGESAVESRFEALRSGTTPLIGREEEVDLLLRRWQQAKLGEGRVVLISGEPGIGKSRLTAALSQRIETEPHTRIRFFAHRTISTARCIRLSASWNAPQGLPETTRTQQSSTSWRRCSVTGRSRETSH